jgi:ANTAR domain/GAF domain/PAS fold
LAEEAGTDPTTEGEQLEVAYEELRVAEEELRSQHETIKELVRSRLADRAALSQLTVAVPVPLVDTDSAGGVVAANPAACDLLRVDRTALTGTPLQTFVASNDRPRVRAALSAVAGGAGIQHLSVLLTPRSADLIRVDVAVVPVTAAPAGEVRLPGQQRDAAARWVAAPRLAGAVGAGAIGALAELATLAVTSIELRPALTRVGELAVQSLDGGGAASIAVGPPAGPDLLTSTDSVAQDADGAQHRAGQGPSWDAYDTGTVTVTERFGADARWPKLTATDLPPVAAALPLLDNDTVLGVLTIYAGPGLSSAESIAQARILAGAAAMVVREHRVVDDLRTLERQLREALDTRTLIGQATGVLMARLSCGPEEAFAALVRLSQHQNTKLRVVAARLVAESAPH